MKITNKTGHALIVVGDKAVIAAYRPDTSYGAAYEFVIPGQVIETEDYEERLDFYFHSSDDGSQWYSVVHVIAVAESPDQLPDPNSIIVPSEADALKSVSEAVAPVMDGMVKGNIAASDLAFAMNIAKHVPAHFAHFKGDPKEAQKQAVHTVFKDWF